MEKGLALFACRLLEGAGPLAPGLLVPWLGGQQVAGRLQIGGVLHHGGDLSLHDPPPQGHIKESGEVAAHRQPEGLGAMAHDVMRRQPVAHRLVIKSMQRAGGEGVEFGGVEFGGAARGVGNVELRLQFIQRTHGRHSIRRARQHRERRHRQRLDASLAQARDGERAAALGQALARGRGQQIVMGEAGRMGGIAQYFKQLELHRRIGDMVLAPDHMGDAQFDVIDHGGERVEPTAIFAHQHRIGERGAINMAVAAHQIRPGDRARLQLEAPVRLAPLRDQRLPIRVRQRQRRAVVDGRQATANLALAAPVQLVGGFETGIEATHLLQPLCCRSIMGEAVGLAHHKIGNRPQPGQIHLDGVRIFGLGALHIRIVEAQNETAVVAAREQIVEQRRARIAKMDAASGRRRETDDGRAHAEPWGLAPTSRALLSDPSRIKC